MVEVSSVHSLLHPWQLDPHLPTSVSIDLSNQGWDVCKRNGWVTDGSNKDAIQRSSNERQTELQRPALFSANTDITIVVTAAFAATANFLHLCFLL